MASLITDEVVKHLIVGHAVWGINITAGELFINNHWSIY